MTSWSQMLSAHSSYNKLDEYNFLQILGSGAFGKVYKVSVQILAVKWLIEKFDK